MGYSVTKKGRTMGRHWLCTAPEADRIAYRFRHCSATGQTVHGVPAPRGPSQR
jgi:hypothetical protein